MYRRLEAVQKSISPRPYDKVFTDQTLPFSLDMLQQYIGHAYAPMLSQGVSYENLQLILFVQPEEQHRRFVLLDFE